MKYVVATLDWAFIRRDSNRPRTATAAAIQTLGIVVLAATFFQRSLRVDGQPTADVHALTSMDMAFVRVTCGIPSTFSNNYRAPFYVRDHPDAANTPLRTIVVQLAGRVEAYCQSATQAFVNNENGLMLLDSLILRAAPSISFAGMGRALQGIRVAVIIATVWTLLLGGASGATAASAGLAGVLLLEAMKHLAVTVFPFLFVSVLATANVCVWCLRSSIVRTRSGVVAVSALAAVAVVLGTNLRTSYLLVFASMWILTLGMIARDSAARISREWIPVVGIALLAFVVGWAMTQYLIFSRDYPAPSQARVMSTHSIAHPLVLGLAVPPSDFTAREGIEWLDASGERLAMRADPSVRYLDSRYDETLFRYYRMLWREHPREMLRVYWIKFDTAGTQMVQVMRQTPGLSGRFLKITLLPLAALGHGLLILGAYAAAAACGIGSWMRTRSIYGACIALLSVAAVLVQVESSVIVSVYNIAYHNYLAFYAVMFGVVGFETVATAAWRLAVPRES
jgi:hypothetical protein